MTRFDRCARLQTFLAACGALLANQGCQSSEPSGPTIPNRVHVADGFIRDATGSALILRGVNVSGAAKQPTTDFVGWHTEADIASIEPLGFNTVRLLVFWEAIEPEPGSYDEVYLERVDERVRWAATAGLFVILDMHQDVFGRGFGHAGAPRWACDDSLYASFEPPAGHWYMAYLSDEVISCFDQLWQSDSLPAHLVGAWAQVAARYADEPAVIGFDLFNEPHWGSQRLAPFERHALTEFYEDAMDAIDAVAPGKLIFIEPTSAVATGYHEPGFLPFARSDVVYAPHYYHLPVHDGEPYDGNPEPMFRTLATYRATAERLGAAWWLGEYGAPTDGEGFAEYIADLQTVIGSHGIGSAYWSYDASSFGPFTSDHVVKPEWIETVSQPYPQRIGGQPQGHRFDSATETLTVAFGRRAGVEPIVEIWAGSRASGAEVTSSSGGCKLRDTTSASSLLVACESTAQELELSIHFAPARR